MEEKRGVTLHGAYCETCNGKLDTTVGVPSLTIPRERAFYWCNILCAEIHPLWKMFRNKAIENKVKKRSHLSIVGGHHV